LQEFPLLFLEILQIRVFGKIFISTYLLLFKIKKPGSTPEKIKKFRKSDRDEPGIKQIHRGIYDDPKEWDHIKHGKPTSESLHVNDCIYGTNLNGIKYFMNEMKEQKYAKAKREPLGKSIMRNYNFPEIVKDDKFKFGLHTFDSNK
jgi:hypothetical protein